MTIFTAAIEQASDILWNSLLLFLLVGTGVFFTIRLRGVQLRRFGEGFHRVFGSFTLRGKRADDQGMSSFQALATAIAAQVGTGNITGCATALVSGGPGALFWVWVSAFFGMATIYAEAVLAQRYRTTVNGKVTGGPAYYIRAAFKGTFGKVLAGVFSVLIILALGFMGNMVQSNSIGDAFHNAFGVNRLVVGVIVAAIAAFIFLGGVQRIAAVTEKVVPVMAAFYILGCIAILVINAKALPGALAQPVLIQRADLFQQHHTVLGKAGICCPDVDMGGQAGFVQPGCNGRCNDGGAVPVADLILYDKYRPYAPLLRSHDRAQVGVKNLSAVYFHRKDLPLLVTESISRGRSF